MGALAGPFEILELGDGGSVTTTVERFEEGEMLIHPRDGREPKTIAVLRIYVPKAAATWILPSLRLRLPYSVIRYP